MNSEYITQPGDRWDIIAYKAYGTVYNVVQDDGTSANAMGVLIRANPKIPISDVLDSGLLLQIPIIHTASVGTDLSLLPPWKTN